MHTLDVKPVVVNQFNERTQAYLCHTVFWAHADRGTKLEKQREGLQQCGVGPRTTLKRPRWGEYNLTNTPAAENRFDYLGNG